MHDVVVIGGGCIGSATALQLQRAQPGIDVVVIEPDPTYATAATMRATGGVRQLFTRQENIALSQYTLDVIHDWACFLGLSEEAPDLDWTPNGYLFIAPRETTKTLEQNYAVQTSLGVAAEWLDLPELAARFPQLETNDLGPAVLSPHDGWLDPHAFLKGTRQAAQRRGVAYLTDRVTELSTAGPRVTGVTLASGKALTADSFVDAAGVAAPKLAAQAGMPLPVEPMPRHEHYVDAPGDYTELPFIKDPDGLAVRPEGSGLAVGLVDFDRPASVDLPADHGYFDHHVWPALAHRIPGLDSLRLRRTWSGHYDQNRLDGNMIIGNWPGHVENFFVASGFSGHGLMHSPGVGRALAELIVHGKYRTIDLTAMGYQRVPDDKPYPELGVR